MYKYTPSLNEKDTHHLLQSLHFLTRYQHPLSPPALARRRTDEQGRKNGKKMPLYQREFVVNHLVAAVNDDWIEASRHGIFNISSLRRALDRAMQDLVDGRIAPPRRIPVGPRRWGPPRRWIPPRRRNPPRRWAPPLRIWIPIRGGPQSPDILDAVPLAVVPPTNWASQPPLPTPTPSTEPVLRWRSPTPAPPSFASAAAGLHTNAGESNGVFIPNGLGRALGGDDSPGVERLPRN
jgi:hypothetical protein